MSQRTAKKSETRTRAAARTRPLPAIPTLGQMVRDGQVDAARHKQRTRNALAYWFRQSERLNIARTHHGLRGERFKDFARRIGVDRSSAFELVKLWKHKGAILARCQTDAEAAAKRGEPYYYPGWARALSWFEPKASFITWPPAGSHKTGDYWLTPPARYQAWDAEFGFDFDPCPYPLPPGWDGIKMEWGQCNWVNAPFSRDDGPGITAFVRKGIAEQEKGKTSVFIVPVPELLNLLIAAGAEIRPVGRMPFLDIETGKPCPRPLTCSLFVLRGKK